MPGLCVCVEGGGDSLPGMVRSVPSEQERREHAFAPLSLTPPPRAKSTWKWMCLCEKRGGGKGSAWSLSVNRPSKTRKE